MEWFDRLPMETATHCIISRIAGTFVSSWSTTAHREDLFILALMHAAFYCILGECFQSSIRAISGVWLFQVLKLKNSNK